MRSQATKILAGVALLMAAAASRAYRDAHAEEKFLLHIQENTGHTVTSASRQAAAEWLVKWLKPSALP